MKKGFTKKWKVYGANGHRQAQSFGESVVWDWSDKDTARILSIFREDVTGTNDYVLIAITRNTEDECEKELWAQISDGLFENCRVGNVIEV